MIKLLMYGTFFYLGYKWGSMTPDQRKQFIENATAKAKTEFLAVKSIVTDEFGNPVSVQTGNPLLTQPQA